MICFTRSRQAGNEPVRTAPDEFIIFLQGDRAGAVASEDGRAQKQKATPQT